MKHLIFPRSFKNLFLNILIMAVTVSCNPTKKTILLTGTYTNSGSKGIYSYHFNEKTGKVTPLSHTNDVVNPSFLQVSGNFIYAVNETNGDHPGAVSAFSFDRKNGDIRFLNQVLSGGDDPCYLEVSKDGRWLVVANYSGGSLSVLPIQGNGQIGNYVQLIRHSGSGADLSRQEAPHVHQTVFSPDGRYVLVPDLGLDRIFIYKFDPDAPQPLTPADQPFVQTAPASGPRHVAFGKKGDFVYCVHELDGQVSVYSYRDGVLNPVQTVSAHPGNEPEKMDGAEVKTSADGRFLYVSNRGAENSISVFTIDPSTGQLRLVAYQPTGGAGPRDFAIDPTGQFLIVAHQNSDNMMVYQLDTEKGTFGEKDTEVSLPKPVCLIFTSGK